MSSNRNIPHLDTVLRVAPQLMRDRNEPFDLVAVGITVMDESGRSPSFNRSISLERYKAKRAIEYALFWDYDIQHIYDLEHLWIYLDARDVIVGCECSFHGSFFAGLLPDYSNMSRDGRPIVYSQPGKHGMSPVEAVFHLLVNVRTACNEDAGKAGVLEPQMLSGQFHTGGDLDERARRHLRQFAFHPAFEYVPYTWDPAMFMTWDELKTLIPQRMRAIIATL